MQSTTPNGRSMDWHEEVSHDREPLTLLSEGEAEFAVIELAKTRSERLNAPMAKLTLRVSNAEGTNVVYDYLVLHTSLEHMLCDFFTAIGHRRYGEAFIPRWNEVVGASGRCIVCVDNYTKDDGTAGASNKVRKYLPPNEEPAAAMPRAEAATA